MNQHTTQSSDLHKQIIKLLPWYINQNLEDSERHLVDSHLHNCKICKGELLSLRKLSVAVNQSFDMELAAAEASFTNFRMKLQANTLSRQNISPISNSQPIAHAIKQASTRATLSDAGSSRQKRNRFFGNRMLKPLAIAASVLLLITPLAMQVSWLPLMTGDYYTLSAAKPEIVAGRKLRVVFAKSLPEASVDRLLKQINGQRVEGPNSVGAYLVSLNAGKDDQDLNSALIFLRSQADVVLAEPVN